MTITTHPGFQAAIDDADVTASEAKFLIAALEVLEEFVADPVQFAKASGPVPGLSRPVREAYPIARALASETCIASALRETLLTLSENSSPSSDPLSDMTVTEIMRLDAGRVQQ